MFLNVLFFVKKLFGMYIIRHSTENCSKSNEKRVRSIPINSGVTYLVCAGKKKIVISKNFSIRVRSLTE